MDYPGMSEQPDQDLPEFLEQATGVNPLHFYAHSDVQNGDLTGMGRVDIVCCYGTLSVISGYYYLLLLV